MNLDVNDTKSLLQSLRSIEKGNFLTSYNKNQERVVGKKKDANFNIIDNKDITVVDTNHSCKDYNTISNNTKARNLYNSSNNEGIDSSALLTDTTLTENDTDYSSADNYSKIDAQYITDDHRDNSSNINTTNSAQGSIFNHVDDATNADDRKEISDDYTYNKQFQQQQLQYQQQQIQQQRISKITNKNKKDIIDEINHCKQIQNNILATELYHEYDNIQKSLQKDNKTIQSTLLDAMNFLPTSMIKDKNNPVTVKRRNNKLKILTNKFLYKIEILQFNILQMKFKKWKLISIIISKQNAFIKDQKRIHAGNFFNGFYVFSGCFFFSLFSAPYFVMYL